MRFWCRVAGECLLTSIRSCTAFTVMVAGMPFLVLVRASLFLRSSRVIQFSVV